MFHPQMLTLRRGKSKAVVKRLRRRNEHLRSQRVKHPMLMPEIKTDLWMTLMLERVLKLIVHPELKIRGGKFFLLDLMCFGLHPNCGIHVFP